MTVMNTAQRSDTVHPDDIQRQDFSAYLSVQNSGVTNMFDIRTVGKLSGLDRETIIAIMKNYGYLKDKFTAELKLQEELDQV